MGQALGFRCILLASHGTPGARAAEDAAFAMAGTGGCIHHLVIVPEFWRGMMGDDWLNNAATQIRFGHYVEDQLQREIAVEAERVLAACQARGLAYEHSFTVGRPAECLLETARNRAFDLVVIGAPRPKKMPGYRSRMQVEPLVQGLKVPLFVAPHPGR